MKAPLGDTDNKDKKESRRVAAVLVSLLIVLAVGVLLLLPSLSDIVATQLAPGVGLRTSAIIAFFVSVVLMIVFTLSSGDGLIGEVQFVIPGFLLFFVILWLMIAWIF